MYIGLHVKYPSFLPDFKETWIFSTVFWKILNYQISWQSVQWEPSSLWMDGQTGRHDEANSHFFQYCKCALWMSVIDVHGLEGKGSWRKNFQQVSEHRCWDEGLSHSRLHLPEICCAPAVKLIAQSLEALTSRFN